MNDSALLNNNKMLSVNPLISDFMSLLIVANIGGANRNSKKAGSVGTGKETLRLRSKGPASIEVVSSPSSANQFWMCSIGQALCLLNDLNAIIF